MLTLGWCRSALRRGCRCRRVRLPCLQFTLTYPTPASTASPVVYVASSATSQTLIADEGVADASAQPASGFTAKYYCVPLTTDNDQLVFTLADHADNDAALAVSTATDLDLVPANSTTAAVLSTEIYRATLYGSLEREVICAELGTAFPSTAVFNSSVPDAQLACDAATTAEQRAKLIELLAGSGVVAFALAVYAAWDLHRHDLDPPPDPNDPDPGPTPDPAPFPAVLEREQVVSRIMQARPSLDAQQAGDAADACLATEITLTQVATYTGPPMPCLTYALFFPGRNAGGAAIHDRDAILIHPEWAVLTYQSRKSKKDTVAEKWYNVSPYSAACTAEGLREAAGVDCDEYPFYITVEGGPGASLRDVIAGQNKSEGASLGRMVNNPACEMATNYNADVQPGSESKQYLVIPVAVEDQPATSTTPATYSGPRTFHVCGDERSISGGGGAPS